MAKQSKSTQVALSSPKSPDLEGWFLNEEGNPHLVSFTDSAALYEAIALNYGDDSKRLVEKTVLGEFTVSTVFISALNTENPPLLWETMVFYRTQSRILARYPTRESALIGHAQYAKQVEKQKDKIFADLEV